MVTQSRAKIAAVGMLLLIGLAVPPPGATDDKTPPDPSPDIKERGIGDVVRPEVAPRPKTFQLPPSPTVPEEEGVSNRRG